MRLHFGRSEKSSRLPEPAWGLSRYAFDAFMRDRANCSAGEGRPEIVASGRSAIGARGRRLFGFKAHFEGPLDDAVELFFFDRCYVGINAIEAGKTNVCGLAPEDFLRRFDFDFDAAIRQSPALSERIAPLSRSMKWISTGPLQFEQRFSERRDVYLAGDALSFVDPFTGSGLVAAVKTGALAGTSAARGIALGTYYAECKSKLKKPFEIAVIFRQAVRTGWAERLAGFLPGRLLFSITRPGK